MKKFYSIKLRYNKENIPPRLAEQMLIDESRLIAYLWKHHALEFRYPEHKRRLDLYADEKYLIMGKLKYPTIFGNRKKMGFMELYIAHRINQRLNLAKGST